MSPDRDHLFDIWFPAIVGGLFIGLLAAALWDILRRKTWTFASRLCPGVLQEVGLEQSRAEVEERQREVNLMLSALEAHITRALAKPPAKSNLVADYDVEAQTCINIPLHPSPLHPKTFTATAYFRDDTPIFVVRRTLIVFKRHARGTIKRWKSSIVVQASLPVDPSVLAEIGELAKDCMHVTNECTFQLGNWAILYYNAGKVHLRVLTEGEVPVNVEARWQERGITMSGLYLNGAQVKVATEETGITLRDDGPAAAEGPGDLDTLFFPTEEVDVPEDDSLICAAKVVQADGVSLTVRSEASWILPPWEKSLRELMWDHLQRISLSAKKKIKSLLKIEYPQPIDTSSRRDFEDIDLENIQLLAEHWKGVSEIQLLETRKEVLYFLQELPGLGERVGLEPLTTTFIGDQYCMNYWQRGLQDLNEAILFWNCPQNTDGLQCDLHLSVRGGIKVLLGDFEGALQDFDLSYNINMTRAHGSTLLLDRALAKCMLARYSEAMQDVLGAMTVHPNLNDIQELHICLQQILRHLSFRSVQYGPSSQQPQHIRVPIMPDLLTGGEWQDSAQTEDVAPPFGQLGNEVIIDPSDDVKMEIGDNFSRQLQGADDSNPRDHLCHTNLLFEPAALSARRSPQLHPQPPGFKGVRQRKGVHGYLVEIRPPKWKRTIWLGTYNTDREAAGAYDAGIFYTHKKTRYNFPHLKVTFPPLPSHLSLDRPEDAEETKRFIQREARLAAQKAMSLAPDCGISMSSSPVSTVPKLYNSEPSCKTETIDMQNCNDVQALTRKKYPSEGASQLARTMTRDAINQYWLEHVKS